MARIIEVCFFFPLIPLFSFLFFFFFYEKINSFVNDNSEKEWKWYRGRTAECKRILREIARARKKRENWEERGEWKRGKEDKVETRRERRIVESGWKRVKKVGKKRREGRETREKVRIRAASNPCLPLVSSCFSLRRGGVRGGSHLHRDECH